MARLAFVVHPGRRDAKRLADEAGEWLTARGHHFAVDPATVEGADLVVSIGGDGTMLRSALRAAPEGIPVLGVNMGRLGYLTEVEPTGLVHSMERFLDGDYSIEERMTLEVRLERDGTAPESTIAMNEAVVEKTLPGHTIRIAVSIGHRPVLTYEADGLIVATPTGSTAYNFSVRGPILSPHLRALVVTPISPHMLFDRALVLHPGESLRLEVVGDHDASLLLDGRTVAPMGSGSAIVCSEGAFPARFVTFATRDVYGVLRSRFGLTDR